MLYCVGFVYVTYFLQENGITASMIGVVVAVCGVISAFLQTWIGSLADKGNGLNWKSIMIVLIGLNLAVCVGMTFITEDIAVVVMFGSFMTFINCMMPLVNAACFYYWKKDIIIDFGSARAVGSLAFALISIAIGRLTVMFGAPAVIAAGMELLVLFKFSVLHKKFGTKKLLLACGIFYCIRGALYLVATTVWHIYLIQTLQAVTFAIFASASTYYSDEIMEAEDKVTGQGLMAAVLTVGGVIGNLQGGFTFDMFGIEWMIVISLIIAIFGTVLVFVSNRKQSIKS